MKIIKKVFSFIFKRFNKTFCFFYEKNNCGEIRNKRNKIFNNNKIRRNNYIIIFLEKI
jgi:hypothetical protein